MNEARRFQKFCWNVKGKENDCFKMSILSIFLEKEIISKLFKDKSKFEELTIPQKRKLRRKIENRKTYSHFKK